MYNRSSMAATLLLLGFFMATLALTGAQSIGVCYGKRGDNLPSPDQVVSLYKSKQIGRMRIYDPEPSVLQALKGSDIELMLGVPNTDLQRLADAVAASAWVDTNVKGYPDVKIKYIAVGNEVSPANDMTKQFVNFVSPAMQNIQNAIVDAGLQDQIKVSTVFDTKVIENSSPPSMTVFKGIVQTFTGPIIDFLVNNRSPFLVNVYPYFSFLGDDNVHLPFALFKNTDPEFIDSQSKLPYKNLFDALLDSVYTALEKAGGSALEVVVSESGWPSDEGKEATAENAQTYNQNLIEHVKTGTPKKPGAVETYIFAMFNENMKDGAPSEKHFGLFNPNKQPAYPINFS